ncbi:hypothetical protein ABPG74_001713 [Tetrahymena malaccensis]
MFPSINSNVYQQPQYDQQQQQYQQDYNFNQFTMNPNQFNSYYQQPFEAPINKYTNDLDSYYQNNRDKVFAKFNQRYTNPNPPLGGTSKMSLPQIPQIKLPAVDWQNFYRDAQYALQNQNKFMKDMDTKVVILDNLIQQSDDWVVQKYYENKQRFEKVKMQERNFKLKKALTDYRRFAKKYYGAFKNPPQYQLQDY